MQEEALLLEQLAENPRSPNLLFALANVYSNQQKFSEAELLFQDIQSNFKPLPFVAHNYGVLLESQGRFAEAAQQYLSELRSFPEHGLTWRHLGQVMLTLGDIEFGLETLKTAASRFPQEREIQFALALAYLRLGNWENGWPLYETRWLDQEVPPGPEWARPWHGESIEGASILVTAEQGLGDFILFARFLPELNKVANKISIWCQPPLWRLIEASYSDIGIHRLAPGTVLDDCNFRIPICSLPLALMSTGVSFPPKNIPYLRTNPDALERSSAAELKKWRRSTPNVPVFGLVWRGRPDYAADHARSLSLGALLSELAEYQFRFISLQLDPSPEELAQLENAQIPDFSPALIDLHATANLLNHLDGLVSVDTASANLAGALGCPLVILQREDSDWRWGLDKTGSAWFNAATPISINRDWLRQYPAMP